MSARWQNYYFIFILLELDLRRDLDLDLGSCHTSCITHWFPSIPNVIEIGKKNFLWTDGRRPTDVRTDRHNGTYGRTYYWWTDISRCDVIRSTRRNRRQKCYCYTHDGVECWQTNVIFTFQHLALAHHLFAHKLSILDCPAFSTPAYWFPHFPVPQFPPPAFLAVPHFLVSHFQSPRDSLCSTCTTHRLSHNTCRMTTVHPQSMPKYRFISQWFNVFCPTRNRWPTGNEWYILR